MVILGVGPPNFSLVTELLLANSFFFKANIAASLSTSVPEGKKETELALGKFSQLLWCLPLGGLCIPNVIWVAELLTTFFLKQKTAVSGLRLQDSTLRHTSLMTHKSRF